jgi:hypothetical protein
VAPVRRTTEPFALIASFVVNFLAPRQLPLPAFSVLAKLPSISHIAERSAIQFEVLLRSAGEIHNAAG